ncbi:hypothetical protein [Kitasatospora sp. HPMI-4]|uniref:hypothetical protein n=1 Tax=Kitasatospora sp. HPMI-4 TaxID=3448443 RepID=UPI003F1B968F
MPKDFGAWSTVRYGFRKWRDAGVLEVPMEGLIAEAAERGEVDMPLKERNTVERLDDLGRGPHPEHPLTTAKYAPRRPSEAW